MFQFIISNVASARVGTVQKRQKGLIRYDYHLRLLLLYYFSELNACRGALVPRSMAHRFRGIDKYTALLCVAEDVETLIENSRFCRWKPNVTLSNQHTCRACVLF